jgi:D-beta-D-heptose 7-phosphate kinase/D-beta-D-heptose 1-phosphate adenosyltransferase
VSGPGRTSQDLERLLGSFPGRRVLVLGDVLLDLYLQGRGTRLCREAPVPVVELDEQVAQPGGAANVAANIASLGGEAVLVGVVGEDPEARLLVEALQERGVDPDQLVASPGGTTVTKRRIVANGQILVRVDQFDRQAPPHPAIRERCRALLDEVDAVVLSDYGCGTLAGPVVDDVAAFRRRRPDVPVLVDGRRRDLLRAGVASGITPNYEEALAVLGLPATTGEGRVEQLHINADQLLLATGADFAAVTLDQEGALLLARDEQPYRTYARPVTDAHTTGAGDTFLAALALVLSAGGSRRAGVELASAAAGLVCRTPGTGVCPAGALRAAISDTDKQVDLATLVRQVEGHRVAGRRIVLTNGVFDLLHQGQVGLLSRAKALGDVLVVGVNSDDSTRRLKGPARPVHALAQRLRVLAELSCVDHVVSFEADDACDLLRALRPDVYVKGGPRPRHELPELPEAEALGIAVHVLPHEDESTAQLIARIRRS